MKNSKCSKEANRLKEEGNKLFVAGKFQQSLERYNSALLRVDQEDEARSFSLAVEPTGTDWASLRLLLGDGSA